MSIQKPEQEKTTQLMHERVQASYNALTSDPKIVKVSLQWGGIRYFATSDFTVEYAGHMGKAARRYTEKYRLALESMLRQIAAQDIEEKPEGDLLLAIQEQLAPLSKMERMLVIHQLFQTLNRQTNRSETTTHR